MALLDSEIQRIRQELGYPNLNVAAEPYIGVAAIFTQVIQPFTLAGAITSSSTPVQAQTAPTPQTIVLASSVGVNNGDVLVIDVDTRQERATIQNLSGTSATVLLSLAHTGTYSVTVEGGESLIRDILGQLRLIGTNMNGQPSAMSQMVARLGLKKVDDVEFFGGGQTLASQGVDPLTQLIKFREYWRDELAVTLGIPRLNGRNSTGGSSVSVY